MSKPRIYGGARASLAWLSEYGPARTLSLASNRRLKIADADRHVRQLRDAGYLENGGQVLTQGGRVQVLEILWKVTADGEAFLAKSARPD